MLVRKVQQKYKALFQSEPRVFRSPASLCLLGEHASYNQGFIIQAAINMEIIIAAAPNQTDIGKIYSIDEDRFYEFNVDTIEKSDNPWFNHILAIIKEFRTHGLIIGGFECVLGTEIPTASGLSASEALMGGMGYMLNQMFQLGISEKSIAKYAYNAYREFMGSTGFFAAHLVNMTAKTNHFMITNFQNKKKEFLESDLPNCRLILFDPQEKIVENQLLKQRILECEEGLSIVNKYFPNISSLTDCHQDMLLKCKDDLGPVLFRRCNFIINENNRTIAGIEDLRKNRLTALGEKMYMSHTDLRHEYDMTSEALDFLVETVMPYQNVLGARMMGLGSGGCTINLVKDDDLNEFVNDIQRVFKKKFRRDLLVYKFKIAKATSEIDQ